MTAWPLDEGGALDTIAIRKADAADTESLAKLVTELGYPTSAVQMQRRLDRILQDDEYNTFVAHEDGRVVGFVGTRVGPLYEGDGLYGQIMALAVAPTHQRRGVGRTLMRAAESALLDAGARVMVVNSANHRAGAHGFYESCGYTFTGRRYKKLRAVSAQPDAAGR